MEVLIKGHNEKLGNTFRKKWERPLDCRYCLLTNALLRIILVFIVKAAFLIEICYTSPK